MHSMLQSIFSFFFISMSLLNELSKKEVWQDFRDHKSRRDQLTRKELRDLDEFISKEEYLKVTENFSFGLPVKKLVVKMNSARKRVVYSFGREETWVLKLLAYLLYKYDNKVSDSCYSFRKHRTSKTAFDDIRKIQDLNERYVLKADIHDYFNSIDVEQLIVIIKEIIDDDEELVSFLSVILRQDKCIFEGEVIEEKRGAMAGVPLASFFANIYLLELDAEFAERGIPYFRYSDDIIIFTRDEKEREEVYTLLKEILDKKKLELNPDKLSLSGPHETWEFLGFSYKDGSIDLSSAVIKKMKARIRRKAHSVYRWKKRKKASFEKAATSMIRSFDYRFYDLTGDHDFTWTRFYFPVVNSVKGFKEIDDHMEMYLRYLYSGRHYKGNYKVTYEDLKKLGYTPLTAEYYNWKKENVLLRKQNDKAGIKDK